MLGIDGKELIVMFLVILPAQLPVAIVYFMVAVPADVPVTIPLAFTVARPAILLQTPPIKAFDSVIDDPTHTLFAPIIAGIEVAFAKLTFKVAALSQPAILVKCAV